MNPAPELEASCMNQLKHTYFQIFGNLFTNFFSYFPLAMRCKNDTTT